MTPFAYRASCVAVILMTVALVGAPIWDHFYYRSDTAPADSPPDRFRFDSRAAAAHLDSADQQGDAGTPSAQSMTTAAPVAETGRGTLVSVGRASGPVRFGVHRTAMIASITPAPSKIVPGPPTPPPTTGSAATGSPSATRRVEPSSLQPKQTLIAASEVSGRTVSLVPAWPPSPSTSSSWGTANSFPAGQEGAPAGAVSGTGGTASGSPANTGTSADDGTVPVLSVIPDHGVIAPGDPLKVQVAVKGGASITSVPFHLLFDPEILEFVGAREGVAFRASSLQPIMLASVNSNRPGDLAVGLSLVESPIVIHGVESVVTLEFRAVGPGNTVLALDRATLHGPTGEPLPAAFLSSAVTVR